MKNKLILFFLSFCILLGKDFDLHMSVYSDVESNNVFFDVTPNKTKDRILESQPVSFYFLLNNSFVSAFGDKSYYRVPFHFKDSTHLDFSVFAGRFLPAPSKMSIESIPNENKSIQSTQDLTLYKYSFNTHLDSTTFVSNNFSSEFREFEIQFFSFKNSLRIKDSISLKIDFYLPTLDIIDIRLYRNFSDKNNFQILSDKPRKNIYEPISTIIRMPARDFRYTSGLKVSYRNPANLVLKNILKNNLDTAEQINTKLNNIPVIILASILLIMLIFIGILLFKQFTVKESI